MYVDGADEIDARLAMIKGGGGALTREEIVAAVAERFICIADASKLVETLGRFPLPIEVIPMARAHVERTLASLGGKPRLRAGFTTDNGNQIIDVHGLDIRDPVALESELDHIAGVVTTASLRAGAPISCSSVPRRACARFRARSRERRAMSVGRAATRLSQWSHKLGAYISRASA